MVADAGRWGLPLLIVSLVREAAALLCGEPSLALSRALLANTRCFGRGTAGAGYSDDAFAAAPADPLRGPGVRACRRTAAAGAARDAPRPPRSLSS